MVKLGQHHSSYLKIIKGVPQRSILGPLLFNIFINDIFYFVKDGALYNYADDNTLSYSHVGLLQTRRVVETETELVIQWFDFNLLQANPEKFQAILLGKRGHDGYEDFTVCGITIICEDSVKLPGVTFYYLLNFNLIVSNICKKAAKQINALFRLSKYWY